MTEKTPQEIDKEFPATSPDFIAFSAWLCSSEGGFCARAKPIGDGLYAAIKPLLFHWTLIVGEVGDKASYVDRWCYATQDVADRALSNWDGVGEPQGWHRHPGSGRRRPHGEASKEYNAP